MENAISVSVNTTLRNGASRGLPCLYVTFHEGFRRDEYVEGLKQVLAEVEAGELTGLESELWD